MTDIKLLEIRDRATFIPAFALTTTPANEGQRYLLRRAGYSCQPTDNLILFGYLHTGKCHYEPYKWGGASRTMPAAHKYIEEHWDDLKDGDVIDVEFILGETTQPKISERSEI